MLPLLIRKLSFLSATIGGFSFSKLDPYRRTGSPAKLVPQVRRGTLVSPSSLMTSSTQLDTTVRWSIPGAPVGRSWRSLSSVTPAFQLLYSVSQWLPSVALEPP